MTENEFESWNLSPLSSLSLFPFKNFCKGEKINTRLGGLIKSPHIDAHLAVRGLGREAHSPTHHLIPGQWAWRPASLGLSWAPPSPSLQRCHCLPGPALESACLTNIVLTQKSENLKCMNLILTASFDNELIFQNWEHGCVLNEALSWEFNSEHMLYWTPAVTTDTLRVRSCVFLACPA